MKFVLKKIKIELFCLKLSQTLSDLKLSLNRKCFLCIADHFSCHPVFGKLWQNKQGVDQSCWFSSSENSWSPALLLLCFSLLPVQLERLHDLCDYGRVVQSRHVPEVTGRLHGHLPENPPHDLPGASLRQPLHHLGDKRNAETCSKIWYTGKPLLCWIHLLLM